MREPGFTRIAIVNRGEAAVRLVHAVREVNRQYDWDLRTIALHTEAERSAMFARMADERRAIASKSTNPYLDYETLEDALGSTGADAAWVGWGFVAEHPAFAELCSRLGVTFIGPSADVMRALGDKIGAKLLAEKVGVPVAPWSGGPVTSPDHAAALAGDIGYPLLIKASAGGGGRGIRRVESPDQLERAYGRARDEAAKSFGDPTVFMEHLVTDARHVEVQIAADQHGNVWPLGVRDCSIQRRNQKILEESASPVLTPEQNQMLGDSAADLARAAGYQNVGTVEFMYQPKRGMFAFLEVNTRLQVEHPITELTTGVDLVKLQLHIAAGGALEGRPPPITGHAIEARLNAEDPQRDFAPAPGRIEILRFGSGPGIRVDTGVSEGDTIPPEFDAMVAKVMAWGRDRSEARARLIHALEQTTVGIDGGTTNKAFLVDLLERPEVISGGADTQWLDRLTATGDHIPNAHAGVAVIAAAVEAYRNNADLERRSFHASAARGRPQTSGEVGLTVDCRLRGEQYRVIVRRLSPDVFRFEIDGAIIDAGFEIVSDVESRFSIGGAAHRVTTITQGVEHLIEVDGTAHRVSRDDAGAVRAPAPALVIAVNAEVGVDVQKGAPILVLEAMKMETSIVAPIDGVVTEVAARPGVQVDAGSVLMRIEATASANGSTGDPIDFPALADEVFASPDATERALADLERLRWIVLGADVHRREAIDTVTDYLETSRQLPRVDPRIIEGELAVLSAFADLSSLSRNHRAGDTDAAEAHNPREYFHQYLRSLDVDAEGLPASFRAKLERAAAHYRIDALDRSLELEQASFRMFLAQERAATQLPIVEALLRMSHTDMDALSDTLRDEYEHTLDRLVTATELRFPVIGDLARRRRYEMFDEPAIVAARENTLQEMRHHLSRLRADPKTSHAQLTALLECPEPLVVFLGETTGSGTFDPLLEVLASRFYREVDHDPIEVVESDGRRFATCRYTNDGEHRRLVATLTDQVDITTALTHASQFASRFSPAEPLSVELYTRWDGSIEDPNAVPALLSELLVAVELPSFLRRVSISGATPGGDRFHHTFRPDGEGFTEDLVIRSLHPMIAFRLQARRFQEFHLTRLTAPQDVYLFKATARENPEDERIVAFAEVRNMTPRYTADGRVDGLPALERNLAACANAIRTAQSDLDPDRPMRLNRIQLFVWPVVALPVEAFGPITNRLIPLTAGLGLEETVVLGRLAELGSTASAPRALRIAHQTASGLEISLTPLPTDPIQPLDPYTQRVHAARSRGSVYPYELTATLAGKRGRFIEYDLDETGNAVALSAPRTESSAGIVFGLVRTPTARYPEGVERVAILGDPTKSLGSLAEAECRRILAALDLADEHSLPVEWFAVSAGARISMDTGTENMDWIARVLRRIVGFTQSGGEINVVVAGINVGAQPYWNAEATMLMHTKGILVMTPDSAMVLTGKHALDYSGGVSAEDNFGIGGYDRIMGPNGQAQYWAPDVSGAVAVLLAHYEHAYVAPGEAFPRHAETTDPHDRDISSSPHATEGFTTVGEIFSDEANPGRKKPFDIRSLMDAVIDADHVPLERWGAMRDADMGVVYDAHLGGRPVTMVGVESRPIPRRGLLPADGPDQWTAGTLFPLASKKIARAINAASGSRPVVMLANLSGFDGSPESLARLQLEYGAQIGRAVVNFAGPIVFCVVSRYHGGAFVVFSKTLNDNMQVLAVEGTYASVLGGAPAAAVVFAREVKRRTKTDPRVTELRAAVKQAHGDDKAHLRSQLREIRAAVHAEKLAEKAAEFDSVHSVQRAIEVGSVDRIIPAHRLRPELIAAVERGITRALATRSS